jgi:uncharacterized membrane protein
MITRRERQVKASRPRLRHHFALSSTGVEQVDDQRIKRVVLGLAAASILCGGMAIARALYSGGGAYVFLGWNLILAWVPLGLSLALTRGRAGARVARWALAGVWLLFFPNAPYIVTDLMHLRSRAPVPLWFDAVMVFTFALTGVCLAFVSLFLVHRVVERRRGSVVGWLFVAAVSGLTGLGVYLGRFERWNSWDLVTRPGDLLAAVVGHLLDPFAHARTFGLSAMMAAVFGVSYVVLFALSALRAPGTRAP